MCKSMGFLWGVHVCVYVCVCLVCAHSLEDTWLIGYETLPPFSFSHFHSLLDSHSFWSAVNRLHRKRVSINHKGKQSEDFSCIPFLCKWSVTFSWIRHIDSYPALAPSLSPSPHLAFSELQSKWPWNIWRQLKFSFAYQWPTSSSY